MLSLSCAAAEPGHRRNEERRFFWWSKFSDTTCLLNMRAYLPPRNGSDLGRTAQSDRKAHGYTGLSPCWPFPAWLEEPIPCSWWRNKK